jgi:tRNA isopentenyl-2-thiomethyl-A-37 hydroxylase MiaE
MAGKVLVQTRVAASTKKKLAALAAVLDHSLAKYLNTILERHVREIDAKTLKSVVKAWNGVKESRDTVVRRQDGPR